MSNISMTWRAPSEDKGAIRVEASVVFNDAYISLTSRSISFNSYPVNRAEPEFQAFLLL